MLKEFRLENEVALVTGSTRGLGLRICEMYAEEGAKVVLTGRSADAGEAAARQSMTRAGRRYPSRPTSG